jgi:hypothetical protein
MALHWRIYDRIRFSRAAYRVLERYATETGVEQVDRFLPVLEAAGLIPKRL